MKRSEMLIKIDEVLNSTGVTTRNLYLSEAILNTIENLGMQPPFSGFIEEQDIVDRWGQDTGLTQVVRVLKNKWEKETNE